MYRHVISACYDRKIRIWNIENVSKETWPDGQPKEVIALEGHAAVPTCVKWSPGAAMMASGCTSLALWIPETHEERVC